MSCESYDLRLTTLSPIHIGSGKSYSCCEFVPAKAKSKGQIVKIIKRVNLTNYYSSLSDDRKDTFLASLTNSNFELKQFDKKIKKDFVRYQCIDNSRVDFINEVQEHIKTSDKLYIPGSSIKGAIRTAIFYNLLTEEDMDKIGRDISSNRRNNSFLSNDLLKKHFTSGFGNDAQYNIFRFMQVADTTTTNLPRIEQVLAVMATDDRRKNQFYSRHGKVVKSYLETIGANKNLEQLIKYIYINWFEEFEPFKDKDFYDTKLGSIPVGWDVKPLQEFIKFQEGPGIRNWQYVEEDGINFLNIRCIQNNDLVLDTANMISKEEANGKYAHFMLNEWDLVISSSGTLGRYAIVREEHLPLCLNTSIIRFTPMHSFDHYAYVYSYLTSKGFYHYLLTMGSGSVQLNFGPTHLKQIDLIVPPENILKKYNDLIFPLIEQMVTIKSEISKLTKLRDTLLPKLMSGEIDVSEVNCDLELKYNYMKYLFNQIHTPMSKSVV